MDFAETVLETVMWSKGNTKWWILKIVESSAAQNSPTQWILGQFLKWTLYYGRTQLSRLTRRNVPVPDVVMSTWMSSQPMAGLSGRCLYACLYDHYWIPHCSCKCFARFQAAAACHTNETSDRRSTNAEVGGKNTGGKNYGKGGDCDVENIISPASYATRFLDVKSSLTIGGILN